MTKHTPGPWTVGNDGYNACMVYGTGGGVCMLYGIPRNARIDEVGERYALGMANARLIAAAPDMYEALEAIIARWDTPAWKETEPTADVINRARSALLKAKGDA